MSIATTARAQILLVLSDEGNIYQSVARSFESTLDAGVSTLDIRRVGIQDLTRRIARGSQIVAVGTRACETAADASPDVSVLCALVPKSGFERIRKALPGRRPASLSAIYLDQPVARQFALGRVLLRGARGAGVLIGPDLRPMEREIRRGAAASGFDVDLQRVASKDEVAKGIVSLVAKSDLVLAVHDPTVLTPSTAKWLLHLSYQKRVPVIGFSRAYVQAGAIAAVYSTAEQIGRQAAEVVLAWQSDSAHRLPPPAYPKYFSVEVNAPVARSLDLDLPYGTKDTARIVAMLKGKE